MLDIFIVDDDSEFVEDFKKTLVEDFHTPEFRILSARTIAEAAGIFFDLSDVLVIADIDFQAVGKRDNEGLKHRQKADQMNSRFPRSSGKSPKIG